MKNICCSDVVMIAVIVLAIGISNSTAAMAAPSKFGQVGEFHIVKHPRQSNISPPACVAIAQDPNHKSRAFGLVKWGNTGQVFVRFVDTNWNLTLSKPIELPLPITHMVTVTLDNGTDAYFVGDLSAEDKSVASFIPQNGDIAAVVFVLEKATSIRLETNDRKGLIDYSLESANIPRILAELTKCWRTMVSPEFEAIMKATKAKVQQTIIAMAKSGEYKDIFEALAKETPGTPKFWKLIDRLPTEFKEPLKQLTGVIVAPPVNRDFKIEDFTVLVQCTQLDEITRLFLQPFAEDLRRDGLSVDFVVTLTHDDVDRFSNARDTLGKAGYGKNKVTIEEAEKYAFEKARNFGLELGQLQTYQGRRARLEAFTTNCHKLADRLLAEFEEPTKQTNSNAVASPPNSGLPNTSFDLVDLADMFVCVELGDAAKRALQPFAQELKRDGPIVNDIDPIARDRMEKSFRKVVKSWGASAKKKLALMEEYVSLKGEQFGRAMRKRQTYQEKRAYIETLAADCLELRDRVMGTRNR